MELVRQGARSRTGGDEQVLQRDVAGWVWDFVVGGIGPGGRLKLVDGRPLRAAAALRDAPSAEPALAPYRRLAARMAAQGDQAAVALLLAAGTVRWMLEPGGRGLAQRLDGVRLARRQLVAWLEAHAAPATAEAALAGVDGRLGGLAHLPGLDLDAIAVQPGPVAHTQWSDGLLFDASGPSSGSASGRVLLVSELAPAARRAPSLRLRDPRALQAAQDAPGRQRAQLRARLSKAGVRIVLCRKAPDEELAADLRRDGVYVVGDVEMSMAQRVALATGCTAVPNGLAFSSHDLGQGRIVRQVHLRTAQWLLRGTGACATVLVPHGPMQDSRIEEVEKWLRAVAPVTQDPRVLPGGGAWQRQAARELRAVADHAPGKAPLGVHVVAAALDRIADAVVRNTGADPTRRSSLDPVDDPMACVLPAVTAALEAAIQVLRIDGRHSRRASRPADLRGGLGPAESPRGMPGDLPPLM